MKRRIVIVRKLFSQRMDIGKSFVGHKKSMKVVTGKTNLRGWLLTKRIHHCSKLLGADGSIPVFVKQRKSLKAMLSEKIKKYQSYVIYEIKTIRGFDFWTILSISTSLNSAVCSSVK